jgi:hypothetical protein
MSVEIVDRRAAYIRRAADHNAAEPLEYRRRFEKGARIHDRLAGVQKLEGLNVVAIKRPTRARNAKAAAR